MLVNDENRKVLAVVNKSAGGPTGELLGELEAVGGIDLEVAWTDGVGDGTRLTAAALAEEDGPAIVVAIGGDGTAGEVTRGLLSVPAPPPLLIAPGGTGNSNFRGIWDDLPWPEVVQAVFTPGAHAVRPIDLMYLKEFDSPTLLGISTGAIPETLLVARGLDLSGRERLLTAALQVLADFEPYPGRVVVDGKVLYEGETFLGLVGGVRHRGGLLQLLPDSILDDGLLDVVTVSGEAPATDFATAALSGDVRTVPGVHLSRGKHIRVERTDGQPMNLEHDGELELGPWSGYEVTAMQHAIRVLVPEPAPVSFASAGKV